MKTIATRSSLTALALAMTSGAAFAQSGEGGAGEIIVTANKREQSINDVGLTIQAATADTLSARGIQNTADLGKLVPGFTATQSTFATPVYTLRGIGLYDATISAAPAVAIYTDQIPRNFPIMSDALELDIARVEVLKGPQGTLFGQSSTGGAINYIVGTPTDSLKAGFDASYERFNRADIAGFVSGPLTDTLKARIAVRGISGGAWQYSLTRPGDKNGDTRKIMGRLSLDWTPSDAVRIQASLTGARDRSDTQAPQYAGSFYNIYSAASLAAANANPATANPYGYVDENLYALLTTPGSPGYRFDHVINQYIAATRMNGVGAYNLSGLRESSAIPIAEMSAAQGAQYLLGTPIVHKPRAADWSTGFMRGNRDHYWQGTLRADIDLSDNITLTSLTAYAEKKIDHTIDLDGTASWSLNIPATGSIKAFNQELRLAGKTDRLNWIIGANFDHLKTQDDNDYYLYDYVSNDPGNQAQMIVDGLGDFNYGPVELTRNLFGTKMKTYAGFANFEYEIVDNLTLSGGLRYTKYKQDATYCYNDPSEQQRSSGLFAMFSGLFGAPAGFTVGQGQCFVLGDGRPGYPNGISTLSPFKTKQSQSNWSFRAGINYKLQGGGLLYATVSQGYKAGVFSNIGASTIGQYVPASQEKLISYEGGFKLPLANNRLQINGSAFYYDYSNKQMRAKISDPIWGLLERLINIPKSRVWGLEGELVARPVDGLTLSGSATYIESKVTKSFSTFEGFPVFNMMGFTGDYKGSELPFTPNFMANADVQYEWGMGSVRPFIGGTFVYQSSSNSTFKNDVLRADPFEIPSYATVDLRAGVGAEDGSWKFSLYGRNIFNKYYVTAPTFYQDAYFRMVGKPAIYGASISFRY
jgi:outer membrane receptor protein involved in Fe transport